MHVFWRLILEERESFFLNAHEDERYRMTSLHNFRKLQSNKTTQIARQIVETPGNGLILSHTSCSMIHIERSEDKAIKLLHMESSDSSRLAPASH